MRFGSPGPFLASRWRRAPIRLGGTRAFNLTNSGEGVQSVTQTLNAPTGYIYSLSVYVQAAQPTAVTLLLGSNQRPGDRRSELEQDQLHRNAAIRRRHRFCSASNCRPERSDVFGPQVEAQAAPSAYQKSTTGGVYQNARFGDDAFSFTTTDVNRHSATVNIVYANHL